MCDVYAVIEARQLLNRVTTDDLPTPVRRMLMHAQQKLDDEIEAYFKPSGGNDPCSPQPANQHPQLATAGARD